MFDPNFQLLLNAALAAIAASVALLILKKLKPSRHKPVPTTSTRAGAVFLFEDEELVDVSEFARHLLASAQPQQNDLLRVVTLLGHRFPDITAGLQELEKEGEMRMRSLDGTSLLTGELIGGRLKLTMADFSDGPNTVRIETSVYQSLLKEVETLRAVSMDISFPVWVHDREGHLTWANTAYLSICQASKGQEASDWPPAPAFLSSELENLANEGQSKRVQLQSEDKAEGSWFACQAQPLQGQTLYSAVNIDATVLAEAQLRQFMQTLTKTFSHLTSGLAIFDKERRLVLFNPALTDLTGLAVDFLAARPTLYSVLDRLRDRRMIPEPKDYGSWRREIAELEAAAVDGTFCETWSLPDGRTYRVTGRPHPGGAVAIMMEDISAEMSLTRQFRTELELGQAVIDALDEAIVVFGSNGTLAMVNRAYQSMWSVELDETVAAPPVTEVTRLWMAKSFASPIWGDIRDFVLHQNDRISWDDHVRLIDGTELYCRITPLGGGSTMVGFQVSRRAVNRPERLRASV